MTSLDIILWLVMTSMAENELNLPLSFILQK